MLEPTQDCVFSYTFQYFCQDTFCNSESSNPGRVVFYFQECFIIQTKFERVKKLFRIPAGSNSARFLDAFKFNIGKCILGTTHFATLCT